MNVGKKMFSSKRKKCPDFKNMHKKVIYRTHQHRFAQLKELAALLQNLMPEKIIQAEDQVCKRCYYYFASMFSVPSNIAISSDCRYDPEIFDDHIPEPEVPMEVDNEIPQLNSNDNNFFEPNLAAQLDEINEIISRLKLNVSPVTKHALKRNSTENYISRKRKKIVDSFSEVITHKFSKAFNVSSSNTENYQCEPWEAKFRLALQNCKSKSENIRLLTVVPDTYSKNDIVSTFPEVTMYMVNEARKIEKEKGVYHSPDLYSGHSVSEADVKLAMEYYLNDDLDCSRQSPNKSDVINVYENGEKIKKAKRFLTRSVYEIFQLFQNQHPEAKIGRTKFYSLRPKWVVIDPPKEVCLCIYCSNFELCLIGLKNIRKERYADMQNIQKEVLALVLCSPATEDWIFQNCSECPGADGITLQSLGLTNEKAAEEVTFAIWNNAELEKRTTTVSAFLVELSTWAMKANLHMRVKEIQRTEIKNEKEEAKCNLKKLILHFDFAENWKKINKQEIQSAYWKSDQVSIFTAVCYRGKEVRSFAVVCDDTKHDSAHALLATNLIFKSLKADLPGFDLIDEVTFISDGAPAHFKNRYQFLEFQRSSQKRKWIFSATGHGKGACDGIGGIVKHFATSHNLRKSHLESINDAETFVSEVGKYSNAIKLLVIPFEDLQKFRKEKTREWKKASAIVGIQKCHIWKLEKTEDDCINSFMAQTAKHDWQNIT